MTTLEINAIRDYLLKMGCKIEYPILVNHFKQHLYNPDPNVQAKIRTKFKDYVNRLATVSLENDMKFIILRPEFRPTPAIPADHQTPLQRSVPSQASMDVTPSARDLPPAKQHISHHSKQMSLPSPFTTPRTTQPQRSPLANVAQQQQQPQPITIPVPPPVPQHNRESEVQQHQQYQANQPMSLLSPQSSSVQTPNIAHHQRQLSQPQQTIDLPQYQQYQQQHPIQSTPRPLQQIPRQLSLSVGCKPQDVQDGSPASMPPPPVPPPLATRRQQLSLQRPESSFNLNGSGDADCQQMPPPRPPPRRRQSTASLFKQTPKPIEKSKEIHDLAKRSPGRVKEHALKLNSFTASSGDLNSLMPMRSNTLKENRLSRDSSIGGSLASALQRNGSHLTTRSRSSHREDESDSSSLQPIDPLRRKWAIEACNCNYNGLLTLLREDPKLASYKDIVNGYTALHWAAKFGNLDIIKLIAGTHGVSANIKSSAGYTPLHVAHMFNRNEAANLLLKSYKANPDIRDHSGKRPMQYCKMQQRNILAK